MAVWGIGSHYRNNAIKDKTSDFLITQCAYIGWAEIDAPALHRMFDSIKIGDIIYIKSFSPRAKQLNIKAIGIVKDIKKVQNNFGTGIKVAWKSNFTAFSVNITSEMYRNNVFNNTLYEEFNTPIIDRIINEFV